MCLTFSHSSLTIPPTWAIKDLPGSMGLHELGILTLGLLAGSATPLLFARRISSSAKRLFAPRHNYLMYEDNEIKILYRLRAASGALIVISVGLAYHEFRNATQAQEAVGAASGWAFWFCLFGFIPATAAVVWFTEPKFRRQALAQMRYPAMTIAATLAVLLLWSLIIRRAAYWMAYGDHPVSWERRHANAASRQFYRRFSHLLRSINSDVLAISPGHSYFWAIVGITVGCASASCFLLFTAAAARWASIGFFRLGDGHPLLPPVLGSFAAWTLACEVLFAGGYGIGQPAAVSIILLLGGPISMTAIAIFEIKRLHDRYRKQFPFRMGPLESTSSSSLTPRPVSLTKSNHEDLGLGG